MKPFRRWMTDLAAILCAVIMLAAGTPYLFGAVPGIPVDRPGQAEGTSGGEPSSGGGWFSNLFGGWFGGGSSSNASSGDFGGSSADGSESIGESGTGTPDGTESGGSVSTGTSTDGTESAGQTGVTSNSSGTTGGTGPSSNNGSSGQTDKPNSGGTNGSGSASSETPSTPAPTEPTLAEKNSQRIAAIQSKYGVTVQTDRTGGVWRNQVFYTGISDQTQIAAWLSMAERVIARYPVGFFRDLNDVSPTFKIKLVTNIPGYAGYASYELTNDLYIAINCQTDEFNAERVFHHEFMHIIDRYIQLKTWGSPNPLDETKRYFLTSEWGNTGSNAYTVWDSTRTPNEQYFISGYAKSSELEDRAETFADYMFRVAKKPYMLNNAYPIVQKQQIIAGNIRAFFPSCAPFARGALSWEKLLVY